MRVARQSHGPSIGSGRCKADVGLDRRDARGDVTDIASACALPQARPIRAHFGFAQRREQGVSSTQRGLLEDGRQPGPDEATAAVGAALNAQRTGASRTSAPGLPGVVGANGGKVGWDSSVTRKPVIGVAVFATVSEPGDAVERRQHGSPMAASTKANLDPRQASPPASPWRRGRSARRHRCS